METMSGIKTSDLVRIEQVDQALLRSLLYGHSKCPIVFLHLETATLKLRHILTINRLMFHHHILSLEPHETIRKIYEKQKSDPTEGDWFQLLQKDFQFIGETMSEQTIQTTSKQIYKNLINYKVTQAAFTEFLREKEKFSKLKEVQYSDFQIQPYLNCKLFNKKERQMLLNLRSRCYPVKNNFKKLYKNKFKCTLGCDKLEDQKHVFTQCIPRISEACYDDIFSDTVKQKKIISIFQQIEKRRNELIQNLYLGGTQGQDPRISVD